MQRPSPFFVGSSVVDRKIFLLTATMDSMEILMTEEMRLLDSWVKLKRETIVGDLMDAARSSEVAQGIRKFTSLSSGLAFPLTAFPLLRRSREDWLAPFEKRQVLEAVEASGIVVGRYSHQRRF